MNDSRIPPLVILNGEHGTADRSEPETERDLLAQVLAELRALRADLAVGPKAQQTPSDDDPIGVPEVCRLLGWSRNTLSRRRAAGEMIPPLSPRKPLRWRRADILAFRDSGMSAREWMSRRRAAKR
jgi:hypothetical protein